MRLRLKNTEDGNSKMWLFTKNSFVSAVQHRNQPNTLIVRARRKQDLVRLFPKKAKQIERTPDADYLFRVTVSKKEFAKRMADYIQQELTYDNFKGAQDSDTPNWMRFLHEVWHSAYNLQSVENSRMPA